MNKQPSLPSPLIATALVRALAYLEGSGLVIEKDNALIVLRLIDELVSADHPHLLTELMQQLPKRLPLPQPELPARFPRIHRGSIGYDTR